MLCPYNEGKGKKKQGELKFAPTPIAEAVIGSPRRMIT
jgi:hypothetical protein